VFLDRIVRGAESRDIPGATLREPPDWMWDAFGAAPTYSGKRVSVETSLGIVSVYAAVRILAEAVGVLPLIVYREAPDGTRRRAPQNRWWRILHDAPNPEQPAGEVWEQVTGHLNLWGNAFLYKAKDEMGRVQELWPIRPSRVRIGRANGKRVYAVTRSDTYTDYGPDDAVPDTLAGDETDILHIRGFGTDGLLGYSPIQLARQRLGVQMAAEEYQGRFYANNASPAGILSVPGRLSDEAARRLKASWDAAHKGLANAAKTAVLEEGTDWKQIGVSLQDQQFVEQQQFGVSEIARLFHVPPHMLNAPSHGSLTYSTTELEGIHFVTYSLMRWTNRIEQALQADADTATMGAVPEFLLDGLLRADSASRAQFYTAALDPVKGWMTRTEVRDRENLPPEEDLAPAIDPNAPSAAPLPAGSQAVPANGNGNGNGKVPTDLVPLPGGGTS
jgi:HK97 family phage portal protein